MKWVDPRVGEGSELEEVVRSVGTPVEQSQIQIWG